MARTPHYGWRHIEEGDADYPQAHHDLVQSIDQTVNTVENRASRGSADWVVETTDGLQGAFNQHGHGDTIRITNKNAPYRTTQFLDIDHDAVTVIGEAADILIQPADGSNVGGIRVGQNPVRGANCEDVTIRGVSYDGNPQGQTMNSGGIGIGLYHTDNCEISRCSLYRTTPFEEHNEVNSQIWVTADTSNYSIVNNKTFESGDRSISTEGQGGIIALNHLENSYDRQIALGGTGTHGPPTARDTVVIGNRLHKTRAGSLIGMSGFNPAHRIIIANNVGTGPHRSGVRIGNMSNDDVPAPEVLVHGNYFNPEGNSHEPGSAYGAAGIFIEDANRSTDIVSGSAIVRDNVVANYQTPGVIVDTHHAKVTDNIIWGNAGPAISILENAADSAIRKNVMYGNAHGTDGPYPATVDVGAPRCWITNNSVQATQATAAFRTDPNSASNNNRYLRNEVWSTPSFGNLEPRDIVEDHTPAYISDVRSQQPVDDGVTMFHDGSGSNTRGPAFWDGSTWVSIVDGQAIN